MHALSTIGQRQQSLLKNLLHNPTGMTVDALTQTLSISRNAVKQHLTALHANGYIESTSLTRSIGRPSRVYTLTDKGRELFPRHYSLLSTLLIDWIKNRLGDDELEACMTTLGEQVAQQFKARVDQHDTLSQAAEEVAGIMHQLGYEASASSNTADSAEIVAHNCVFHKLAKDTHQVCQLDLSLISNLLGTPVKHIDCMARGGPCCRFSMHKSS